jgi:hypothetical protein
MAPGSGRKRPSRLGPEAAWDLSVLGEREHPAAGASGIDWDVSVRLGWPDLDRSDRGDATSVDHASAADIPRAGPQRDRACAQARSFAQQTPKYLLNGAVCGTSAAGIRAGSGPRVRRRRAPEPSLRGGRLGGLRPSFNGDVHVTVVGKETGRRRDGIRVHRVSELAPRDSRRYQGIPITSPARALLDIAPDLTDRALEPRRNLEAILVRIATELARRAA